MQREQKEYQILVQRKKNNMYSGSPKANDPAFVENFEELCEQFFS